MEKSAELGMFVCLSKTGTILIGKRGFFFKGREQNMDSTWKKLMKNGRSWRTKHHSLTPCIWDALNVNANQTKSIQVSADECSDHGFLLEQLKNCHCGRNVTQKL